MTEKKIKNNMSSSGLTRRSRNKDIHSTGFPVKRGMTKDLESGRSMVEMLGVLAVIGVLSVGSIAGYRYAMNRYYTNELLAGASERAVLVSAQILVGKTPSIDEFNNTTAGGTFGIVEEFSDGGFGLRVSGVKEVVCQNVIKATKDTSIFIAKDDNAEVLNEMSESDCSGDNNAFWFVYDDMGGNGGTTDPCADVDCGDNGTCVDGACECDGGYYLDGTECTMCAAGTYAAAGANVCTPCPDGMTSDAGATSVNDCESEGLTCQNGGTWNTTTGQCNCPVGYMGTLCDEEEPECLVLYSDYCEQKQTECETKITCPRTYGECVSAGLGCSCFSCEDYEEYYGVWYVNRDELSDRIGPLGCTCKYLCYTGDTPIMLADGTCKRADEITYDDELLVWDFDNGCFAKSKPLWLKIAQTAPQYNYLRFSDGSVLKTIRSHRIFNREAGKFTYIMSDETTIGTTTFNAKGEYVTLVEKRVVQEEVTYYNIITKYHMNCFTGNVLTSCRLNNLYPIKDMKFVKDDRELVPYSEYAELPRKWYDGLRLAEQPREVNRGNDVVRENTLTEYVQRLIRMAQPESNAKAA